MKRENIQMNTMKNGLCHTEPVCLKNEKELRIFTDPLRQRMINTMEISGIPMTAQKLSKCLNITPSSAKHHLKQLEKIGIVYVNHTETIHGIIATLYALTGRSVRICTNDSNLQNEQMAIAETSLRIVMSGFWKRIRKNSEEDAFDVINDETQNFSTGVIHASQEEIKELLESLRSFSEAHKTIQPGTKPYTFSAIVYQSVDIQKEDEK